MRCLTDREIALLEEQGCWAEDWQRVTVGVDEGFRPDRVHQVRFYGDVHIGSLNGTIDVEEGFPHPCGLRNATLRNVVIGEDCLIENVGSHIANYIIGDHCLISNIGVMTAQGETTFGLGQPISVLSEGGEPNIILHDRLTAQTAWLMLKEPAVRRLYAGAVPPPSERGRMGDYARLIGTREVVNTSIGEYAEITCASRLSDCSLLKGALIGSDAILEGCVVAEGAVVSDGAKAYRCYVGEGVRLGRGFSAESSLFFANCEMLNGEACACLCGPFTCSHHKSTLLIGGAFAFCNAGSGTNFSNHAYKMGPIHHGQLQRGTKTASAAHILWPATIGAFSMVMGKVSSHPDTSSLPFSYVFGEGERTVVVPGIALRSVGTWRDVRKWAKRDRRDPSARHDLLQTAFPNPLLAQQALAGKQLLAQWLAEETQGEWLERDNFSIKRAAAVAGIRYYDLAIRLFIYQMRHRVGKAPSAIPSSSQWEDLCGMLAPGEEVERIVRDVGTGAIGSVDELQEVLAQVHSHYEDNAAAYLDQLLRELDDSLFADTDHWLAEAEQAHRLWLRMAQADAEREFQLGDVAEDYLREFIQSIQ